MTSVVASADASLVLCERRPTLLLEAHVLVNVAIERLFTRLPGIPSLEGCGVLHHPGAVRRSDRTSADPTSAAWMHRM